MNIILAIVVAFPLGYFVKQRGMAVLAFFTAGTFVFSFQTLDVLLNWMAGRTGIGGASAFGPAPDSMPISYEPSDVFAYGLINALILAGGIGLTVLGSVVRARRTARLTAATVG